MTDSSAQPPPAKLLLIGWDAADWNFITPLLDAGRMPHLQRLVERGVMGNLASLEPMLSPILWTTIATGKRGTEHGICSFLEPDPAAAADGNAAALRPVSSTSRTTKALWNICTQNGLKSHVVAWYATHPAEPVDGVIVSDQFLHTDESKLPDWPMPNGAVHPAELHEDIASLRVKPVELLAGDLLPFMPQLGEIDIRADRRPAQFARVLARAASVHAVATAILDAEPWNFLAVFYDAIDTAGHTFMPYHPPAMPGIAPRDAQLYGNVMTAMYEFHDAMLGRLAQLAGDDATILLLSDHGFHHGARRPPIEPGNVGDTEEERAAKWHRPLGIFAMAGPNVRADERVYGASLLDIAPTVLAALNLPAGRDMPGRALTEAFVETRSGANADLHQPSHDDARLASRADARSNTRAEPWPRVASWDAIDGPHSAGLHPADLRVDPIAATESIKQLIDLGYLAAPHPATSDANDDPASSLVKRVLNERTFNQAAIHLHARRPAAAVELLTQLRQEFPENTRYAIVLAQALLKAERAREAIEVLTPIAAADSRSPAAPNARMQLAQAHLACDEKADALAIARAHAERDSSARTPLELPLGWGFVFRATGGTIDEARRCFERVLFVDPNRAEALYGMGALALDAGDAPAAADLATRAVAALYAFPAAHHLLAAARMAMGDNAGALVSLDAAIRVDPSFKPAHELAADIRNRRGDVQRALQHRRALDGHAYPS